MVELPMVDTDRQVPPTTTTTNKNSSIFIVTLGWGKPPAEKKIKTQKSKIYYYSCTVSYTDVQYDSVQSDESSRML